MQAIVTRPAVTDGPPLSFLRIYRAPNAAIAAAQWTLVDGIAPSPISTLNNLYDLNPAIGHGMYYCATALNSAGIESPHSAALMISVQAS